MPGIDRMVNNHFFHNEYVFKKMVITLWLMNVQKQYLSHPHFLELHPAILPWYLDPVFDSSPAHSEFGSLVNVPVDLHNRVDSHSKF